MEIKIKKQMVFSKEEEHALEEVNEKLKVITCKGIDCSDCPFYIKTTDYIKFNCVINIIDSILTEHILSKDNGDR